MNSGTASSRLTPRKNTAVIMIATSGRHQR
jgi:hypothetical protein